MIRPTTPDDTTALIALADATGLFPPSALELLHQMLTDSLGGNSDTEHFWIIDGRSWLCLRLSAIADFCR
jgi:hypothetical protein